jgi:hypothetical protein
MIGSDILPIARAHIGESYILGARAPLTNADHAGPWDCAEYTSWCAYQAYGLVFGTYGTNPTTADAYSGKWYEDADAAGTLISVADALATPGAFVVRKPGDFNIGIGHVAICVGDGSVLEARSASTGVVLSANAADRSWTSGLQLPGVLYSGGSGTPYTAPSDVLRIRHPFMRGDVVKVVQLTLIQGGYMPGGADGVFGPKTSSAVSNFQLVKGLVVDGEVGRETAEALGIGWPIDTTLLPALEAAQPITPSTEDDDDSDLNLRGIPQADSDADAAASAPLDLRIVRPTDTEYWAEIPGKTFFVGRRTTYLGNKGLYQKGSDLAQLIGGKYDIAEAVEAIGDWAYVLNPTIMSESSGYYARINTYDRARFTFGFFQMAAHTPNDNLIVAFRDLLKLPAKDRYFPDLTLRNGRVHQIKAGTLVDLEKVTDGELLAFMKYLNPTLSDVETEEADRAARLMLWSDESKDARQVQIKTAHSTIKAKLDYTQARGVDVPNLPVELGIWVLDVRHHGRAKISAIKTALAKPNPVEAIKVVGSSATYPERVSTVGREIKALLMAHPRFKTMTMKDL